MLAGSLDELVAAVDQDSSSSGLAVKNTATYRLLLEIDHTHPHLSLATEDFRRHLYRPLRELRSDAVASKLENRQNDVNVAIGRMVVPRGPWPGHYGLEIVAYSGTRARFPEWFPPLPERLILFTGEILGSSRAFSTGSGAVLFPELFSVSAPIMSQTFGSVFPAILTESFVQMPLLHSARVVRSPEVVKHRTDAFLAHEWGHLSAPGSYADRVARRSGRRRAVVEEVYADLSALCMLVSESPDASVAKTLLLSRFGGDMTLPRPQRQVDAIASTQLALILSRISGTSTLLELSETEVTESAVGNELKRLRSIVESDHSDGRAADEYLVNWGWTINAKSEFFHPLREEFAIQSA